MELRIISQNGTDREGGFFKVGDIIEVKEWENAYIVLYQVGVKKECWIKLNTIKDCLDQISYYYEYEEIKEEFSKADLKTGMVVTTRNGNEWMVYIDCAHSYHTGKNCMVDVNKQGYWTDIDNYDKNLVHDTASGYDIMKVEICEHPHAFNMQHEYINVRTTVWDRIEKSEVELKVEELVKEKAEYDKKFEDRIAELKNGMKNNSK